MLRVHVDGTVVLLQVTSVTLVVLGQSPQSVDVMVYTRVEQSEGTGVQLNVMLSRKTLARLTSLGGR